MQLQLQPTATLTYRKAEKTKITGLNVLKLLCAFFVVHAHVDCLYTDWVFSIVRIAVPVFFMISGVFVRWFRRHSNQPYQKYNQAPVSRHNLCQPHILFILTYSRTIRSLMQTWPVIKPGHMGATDIPRLIILSSRMVSKRLCHSVMYHCIISKAALRQTSVCLDIYRTGH